MTILVAEEVEHQLKLDSGLQQHILNHDGVEAQALDRWLKI